MLSNPCLLCLVFCVLGFLVFCVLGFCRGLVHRHCSCSLLHGTRREIVRVRKGQGERAILGAYKKTTSRSWPCQEWRALLFDTKHVLSTRLQNKSMCLLSVEFLVTTQNNAVGRCNLALACVCGVLSSRVCRAPSPASHPSESAPAEQ